MPYIMYTELGVSALLRDRYCLNFRPQSRTPSRHTGKHPSCKGYYRRGVVANLVHVNSGSNQPALAISRAFLSQKEVQDHAQNGNAAKTAKSRQHPARNAYRQPPKAGLLCQCLRICYRHAPTSQDGANKEDVTGKAAAESVHLSSQRMRQHRSILWTRPKYLHRTSFPVPGYD